MTNQPYIMLFNFETRKEKKEAKAFLEQMPQAKLLPYGVINGYEEGTVEIEKGKVSLWIPESLFLSAWTYFNYRFLQRGDVTFEDGIDYLNIQRHDSRYVKTEIKEEVIV